MDLATYKQQYGQRDDAAPGWDAISARLDEVYPGQEPLHWATLLPHSLGGPDPLDGISIFQCPDGGCAHLHVVTYGYSELYYDEKAVGGEFSKYGFEMTFRLASTSPPSNEHTWVGSLLQNLARYVFKSGKYFAEYHWIPANGPIRLDYPTDLVGLAFVNDPTLAPLDSPHGRVEFIQAFGLTQSELTALKNKTRTCEDIIAAHRQTNPLLITDLERKDNASKA